MSGADNSSPELSKTAEIAQRYAEPATGFYAAYESYSRVLRTWLVAYGIGAPVLLLTNDAVWVKVSGSIHLRLFGALFLLGVALQVLLAAVNKMLMWVAYYAEVKPEFKEKSVCRICDKLSTQFWLDFFADVAAMAMFAAATIWVFFVVTGG